MYIKKLIRYLIKKFIKFIKFCLVFLFVYHCYYYILYGFWFMQEYLYYDLNIYHFYVILTLVTIYLRYLLSLIIEFDSNPAFYGFIYFYSIYCEIKKIGLLNFVRNTLIFYKNKIKNLVKAYWNFRLKISPLNTKVNYYIYTIYDKYFKNADENIYLEKINKIYEFRLKKKRAQNKSILDIIFNKIEKNNSFKKIIKKKKRKKEKTMYEIYCMKPKPGRILKKVDFLSRYIRWIEKKNNKVIMAFLNTFMSFFIITDFFLLLVSYIFNYKYWITWKPLNIRSPYFKKIKNKK